MSDTKPPKPMPSAAEINAYLEQSAARTRMRLPLAKGHIVVPPRAEADPASPASSADAKKPLPTSGSRALPLQGSKKLPASTESSAAKEAPPSAESGWRPFSRDDE